MLLRRQFFAICAGAVATGLSGCVVRPKPTLHSDPSFRGQTRNLVPVLGQYASIYVCPFSDEFENVIGDNAVFFKLLAKDALNKSGVISEFASGPRQRFENRLAFEFLKVKDLQPVSINKDTNTVSVNYGLQLTVTSGDRVVFDRMFMAGDHYREDWGSSDYSAELNNKDRMRWAFKQSMTDMLEVSLWEIGEMY